MVLFPSTFPRSAAEFGGCIETDQADVYESLQSAKAAIRSK